MALTGEAKKEYQRGYMRRQRSNRRSNKNDVRPISEHPSRDDPARTSSFPEIDADGNPMPNYD